MNESEALPKPVTWLEKQRVAIGIFLLAFFTRFLNLCSFALHPPQTFLHDPFPYDRAASEILRGGAYLTTPFFKPPLYAYFLAALYHFMGQQYLTSMLAQTAVGSFSCILVYRLAKRLFGKPTGVLAGLIAVFYGVFILYDALPSKVTLEIFLSLVFLVGLENVLRKPGLRKVFWLGMAMGLLALVRPVILFFGLSVPFLFAFFFREKETKKTVLKYAGVYVVALSLLPFIATVRNSVVEKGSLVFIDYQTGIRFYSGNNARANGGIPYVPGVGAEYDLPLLHDFAEHEAGHKLNFTQESAYWMRRGLGFVRRNPAGAARLFLKKAYFFWNGYEIPGTVSVYQYEDFSKVLDVLITGRRAAFYFPFGILGAFSIFGMALRAREWRRFLFLYLYVLVVMLGTVAFVVSSASRAAVVPVLIVFAAHALHYFYLKIKSRHSLLELQGVFLIVLIFVFNLPLAARATQGYPEAVESPKAGECLQAKQYVQALALFDEGTKKYPFDRDYWIGKGEAQLGLGDKAAAFRTFEEARKKFPENKRLHDDYEKADRAAHPQKFEAKALLEKAKHLFDDKKIGEALAALRKANEIYPRDGEILFQLGYFSEYNNQGKRYGPGAPLEKAVEYYRESIAVADVRPPAFNMALLYDNNHVGTLKDAEKAWKDYLVIDPENGYAKMRLRDIESQIAENSEELDAAKGSEGAGSIRPGADYAAAPAASVPAGGPAKDAEAFKRLMRQALEDQAAGRREAADEEYLKALTINPNTDEADKLLGKYVSEKSRREASGAKPSSR